MPKIVLHSRMWPQKSYFELRILIRSCHVWPKFEFTPNFGGQTGVFAYFLLSDFHSFCNLGPKVMVQSRMWPEKLHSMQVSNKNDTQQSSDVDSFGLVYAGIYCFAIPAGATRGRMANSFMHPSTYHPSIHPSIHTSLSMHECMHRHYVSVSLLSIMLWVAGGNCVPKVSLLNASAITATAVSQQMTLN